MDDAAIYADSLDHLPLHDILWHQHKLHDCWYTAGHGRLLHRLGTDCERRELQSSGTPVLLPSEPLRLGSEWLLAGDCHEYFRNDGDALGGGDRFRYRRDRRP